MKNKFYSVLPHIPLILILVVSGYLMANTPNQWSFPTPILKMLAGIPFFALISVLLVYIWSRELLGKWWALMPAFLFGFSPVVIIQGHYITAPIAAVFGFLLASYFFTKFLNSRTNKHLFWAGIGLGIALIINPSDIILIPIYLIMLLFFWFGETIRTKFSNMGEHDFLYFLRKVFGFMGDYTLILILALALVYIAYFIPILNLSNPITQYLSEISTAVHGSSSSIHFNSFIKSFPKDMLPILILLILSIFFGLENMIARSKGGKLISKFAEYLGTNFAEFGCLIVIILYAVYMTRYSGNNANFENFLPILPFVYILIVSSLKNWMNRNQLFQ